MCLGGVLVPHRLPPPRTGRIGRGGHVSGRHDTLPPGRRWRLDDLDHPAFASPELLGHKRSLSLPSVPERSFGGWDRQTVTRAGRKARRDVLSPGNRGFTEPLRRRGLPPRSVSAQLRPGKHHGDRQPAAVALTGPYPRPGPDPRRIIVHRAWQPIRKAPCKRVGRAAHRQGSAPRYRAGHTTRYPGGLPE
jgi:hypothetical protein